MVNLILSLVLFATLNEEQIGVYFNSDTLYLPSIFRDLFEHQNGIRGWNLNGAPNFIPDMLLFFIIHGFFSNFIPAAMTFSLIQLIILILLFSLFYKSFIPRMNLLHISVGMLFIPFYMMATLINNNFVDTFYLYSIAYHLGAFVMALISYILLVKYLKKGSWNLLILLIATVMLAVLSDRLFMAMLTFPVVLLILVIPKNSQDKKRLFLLLLGCIVASGLGLLLFKILKDSPIVRIIPLDYKVFNFKNILPAWKEFSQHHLFYLKNLDFRGIIDIVFIFSFLTHIFLLIIKYIKFYRKEQSVDRFELMYLLLFTSASVIILLMPVINGNYDGWSLLRYNVYSLYMGLFSMGYLLFKLESVSKKLRITPILIILLISSYTLLIFNKAQKNDLPEGMADFINYYPGKVECLDSLAREHGLKAGVATYWEAKYISMFSKEDLRIFTVFHSLSPWYHVMNDNWYYFEDGSKEKPRMFNFLITKDILYENIDKYLGQPLDTIHCIPKLEIFTFNDFRYDPNTYRPFYPDSIREEKSNQPER
jgi:hypothetical protein